MLIRKPTYYDEFKCLAGACPETCCAGWAVVVDEAAQERYSNMTGALGQRIRSEMKEDDGDIIFPLRDGRCPFLNDANLCDIQAATDEGMLCRTCRMFPRFENEFGLVREVGLSLSCPEAARLIMSEIEQDAKLIEEQTDEGITQYNDIDPELYFTVTKYRKNLFAVLQEESVSLEDKIGKIVSVAARLAGGKAPRRHEGRMNFCECLRICQMLESFDDGWDKLCQELAALQGKEQSVAEFVPSADEKRELENILFYYVYRYFLSTVLDEKYGENTDENDSVNIAGKLLISVFCLYIILSVYVIKQPKTEAERIELVCKISREVEHSQLNLDIVEKEMAKAIKKCKEVL